MRPTWELRSVGIKIGTISFSREMDMFNNPKSQWVRALVLASALSLPTVASASEDLESRLSTLETQMSELSEKVDMLIASMQKTSVSRRQGGMNVVEPESFMEGYFRGKQDECH